MMSLKLRCSRCDRDFPVEACTNALIPWHRAEMFDGPCPGSGERGATPKRKQESEMLTGKLADKSDDGPTSETFGLGSRQKATAEMRNRANELERQAAGWRSLANALDEIERQAQRGDGRESGPHIGVGSDAETFLWQLACGYVK